MQNIQNNILKILPAKYLHPKVLAIVLVLFWLGRNFIIFHNFGGDFTNGGAWWQFALEFPFLFIVILFFGHINFFLFSLAYALSGVFYVAIIYQAEKWIKQAYLRRINRPEITIKKIGPLKPYLPEPLNV